MSRRSPVLPLNVVPIRPGVGMPHPGAEICAATTTSSEICTPKTTPKTGKTRNRDNVVALSVSSPGITAPSVVSCSRANAALSKAEFMALVHRLSAMELTERFALDYSSFKDMKGRRRNGCVIAPEFRVFRSFLRHMKCARPSPEWTLDRIDPFRMEYGPGLCRWASKETQANNRRDTILLTGTDGRTLPLTEWAKITGQDAKTMRKRRERGGWLDAEVIAGQRNIKAGVAPPAMPFDASEWPAGVTVNVWEAAYVTYCPNFPPPRTYLTRAVFFAWIGQNKIDELHRGLMVRHPGYLDWDRVDPEDFNFGPVHADPQYILMLRYEAALNEAMCKGSAEDPMHATLVRTLRTKYPTICQPEPARLGRLRWEYLD